MNFNMTPENFPKLSLFEDFANGVILTFSPKNAEEIQDGCLYAPGSALKMIKKETAIFLLFKDDPRLHGVYKPFFDMECKAGGGGLPSPVRVKLHYKFPPMPEPFLGNALKRSGCFEHLSLTQEQTYKIISSMIDYMLRRESTEVFKSINDRLVQPQTLQALIQAERNTPDPRMSRNERKIFFSNYDKRRLTRDQKLRKEDLAIFSSFGKVLAADLFPSADDNPMVSGWVEFQDACIAARAVEQLRSIHRWNVALLSEGIE